MAQPAFRLSRRARPATDPGPGPRDPVQLAGTLCRRRTGARSLRRQRRAVPRGVVARRPRRAGPGYQRRSGGGPAQPPRRAQVRHRPTGPRRCRALPGKPGSERLRPGVPRPAVPSEPAAGRLPPARNPRLAEPRRLDLYRERASPRPSACPETGGCTGKRKPATYITRSGSGEPEDEPGFREHSPTPAGAWRALRGATRRRLAGRYRPARRAGAFLPRGRPTRLHPGVPATHFSCRPWPASGSARPAIAGTASAASACRAGRTTGWWWPTRAPTRSSSRPAAGAYSSTCMAAGAGTRPRASTTCGRWRPAWPASARSGAAPAKTSCWTTAASRPLSAAARRRTATDPRFAPAAEDLADEFGW